MFAQGEIVARRLPIRNRLAFLYAVITTKTNKEEFEMKMPRKSKAILARRIDFDARELIFKQCDLEMRRAAYIDEDSSPFTPLSGRKWTVV